MKRLAVYSLLLFSLIYFITRPLLAADRTEAIITKAQELSLKGDRLAASRLLQKGLRENPGVKPQKILMKSLDSQMTIFYTEQAQKSFHLGEAFYYSQDPRALGSFQEALTKEPSHLLVLTAMARLYLQQKKCSDANNAADEALVIHPFWLDALILSGLAQVCLKEAEDLPRTLAALEKRDKSAVVRLQMGQSEQAEDWLRLETLSTEGTRLQPEAPEGYYWLWRAKYELKKKSREAGQKYLNLCASPGIELKKKFKNEPNICQKIETVQNALANTNTL